MENALYSELPQEVSQVANLIGINPGIARTEDVLKNFVHDRIPRKDLGDDFKYKVYSLYEVIDKNKPSWKNNKEPGKRLNCKQKKALFDIKHSKLNYQDFEKVNKLWHSYFESIQSEVKNKPDELKLSRADFHGAFLTVHASKNTSIIGLKGFVVQESKNTFRIITSDNRLLTIPKIGTVFMFEHNNKSYRLNGYNMMMNSFNRSKMKAKFNYICDL